MSLKGLPVETQVFISFLIGFLVSLFNYAIANRAIQEWVESGHVAQTTKPALPTYVAVRYLVRYGTNFLAIYAVFVMTGGKAAPLVAAGIGLLLMRNYYLVREYLRGKEG